MMFKVPFEKASIFFLLLVLAFCNASYSQQNKLSDKEKAEGWQLLFDGNSMNKWRSANSDSFPAKGWTIEDGVLSIQNNGGRQSAGDIITREQFDDFDFMFDFKLTEGA